MTRTARLAYEDRKVWQSSWSSLKLTRMETSTVSIRRLKKNKKTADKIINKSSQKNTTENLIPGTPEHKTQRWKDYEANKGDNSNWTYDRWSKQYDTLCLHAIQKKY